MDTKGLQKEFINWCKSKNKLPKSEDETKQLFVAFMKEKHPEEYKAAMENQLKQAQKALHGAKLNYFKSLKHQCAEDEEVVYYKKGGSVTCGCKKKEDGGEIAKALKGTKALDLFKKRREEQKKQLEAEKNVPNHAPGGTNKSNRFAAEKYYRDKNHKNDYSNNKEETTPPKINKGYGKNEKGGKVNKNCGGSAIKKFKMHRLGGSLNGIPFMQKGTSEGGIKRGINGEYYTMPVPYGASNRTGTNPFMDILTTNISNNPYLITGAPDFLPGMAGGNIGKVVGQIRKLPIGKRGAIRTINGKRVNILDKKVGWAKEADLRKDMDLNYNSKLAGRIDYSE